MSTLINVILDESGSMEIKRADVIGGFNAFLKEQQQLPEQARMSITKFNTTCTTTNRATPLVDIKPLSEKSYIPGGNTALFDAISQTVRLADQDKTNDDRIVCLIITDGEENSSRETTYAQVKELIAEREKQGNWTFVYLGANPEAFARDIGLPQRNTKAYNPQKPLDMFVQTSAGLTQYRVSHARMSKDFWKSGS